MFIWTSGKTERDVCVIHVTRNQAFCAKVKDKLGKVFQNIILPELVSRKLDPNNEKSQKLYCYCKRPTFNPMIACDGLDCKIEWFHYACVNLTRTPPEKKKWFCPDCSRLKRKGLFK